MHDASELRFISCLLRSLTPFYSQHVWTLTVIYRGTTTFFGHLSWHLTIERNALPYPTIAINISHLPTSMHTSYLAILCILHYYTYNPPPILLDNPLKTSRATVTQARDRSLGILVSCHYLPQNNRHTNTLLPQSICFTGTILSLSIRVSYTCISNHP